MDGSRKRSILSELTTPQNTNMVSIFLFERKKSVYLYVNLFLVTEHENNKLFFIFILLQNVIR